MKTLQLSFDDVIVQTKGNIVSNMDGETVMLSIQNGNYYNLGSIGGVIWDLINEPNNIYNIVDSLISEYEVERDTCEKQVIIFLERLYNEGLIKNI